MYNFANKTDYGTGNKHRRPALVIWCPAGINRPYSVPEKESRGQV